MTITRSYGGSEFSEDTICETIYYAFDLRSCNRDLRPDGRTDNIDMTNLEGLRIRHLTAETQKVQLKSILQ